MSPRRNRRRFRLAGLASIALLALAGCRTEMYDQPRNEIFTATNLFANRSSARPLVAGTVARGWSLENEHLFNGIVDGKLAETFPMEIDRPVLERGRQRFEIYCAPCHDGLGTGDGMIVQRGFSKPPTFHSDRLRTMPVGHFFDVQTRGYGAMYSYAARIKPEDRWAIAAYIRVLQQSQNAPEGELSPEDLAKLQEAAR